MANDEMKQQLQQIEIDRIVNSTPANTLGQQRPDARAVLANFTYQYPFNGILPVPPVSYFIDAKAGIATEITLPDGCLVAVITGQPSTADMRMWGSWDGIPPILANVTDNTPTKGVFAVTQEARAWFAYGKKQLQLLANADGNFYVECFFGGDGLLG